MKLALSLPLAILALSLAVACSPVAQAGAGPALPESDYRPPTLLEAGPVDGHSFSVLFDEEMTAVPGSFGLEPAAGELGTSAKGNELTVTFAGGTSPGRDYDLAGEVEDAQGNRCRFVLSFAGYNARPAVLRITEVQPQKNSSVKAPHRDYVEFLALEAGNLGGLEVSWANSTKRMVYRFPAAEVAAGDYVVLHLAPEGTAVTGPPEADETGGDLALSGGVDATAAGRDFWSGAGGLPDENGALSLLTRPGGPSQDALFYAADDKAGAVAEGRLLDLLGELRAGAAWTFAATGAAWEDAFRWHPSAARSIMRTAAEDSQGASDWLLGEPGAQSPGGP